MLPLMKTLVVGANGRIGRIYCRIAAERGIPDES
jgi:hypothetical protein